MGHGAIRAPCPGHETRNEPEGNVMLHVLITQFLHHHICWQLAISYLHHIYPGMPRGWYSMYLHFVENHHIGPRNW
jgi:hypothetical protein